MKYFDNIETLEELKKAYRKLVFKLHPDHNNGDDTEFKAMSSEYEKKFDVLKNQSTNKGEKQENAKTFMDIMNTLQKYKDITIDIVGSWYWVYGETKPIKEELKTLGFRWAKAKKKWYVAPEGTKCHRGSRKSYEDIKNTYGCKSFKTSGVDNLVIG